MLNLKGINLKLFLIVTLTLFTLFGGYLFYKNFILLIGDVKKNKTINVYLKINTLPEETKQLVGQIENNPKVEKVSFINRDATLSDFSNTLGSGVAEGIFSSDELLDLLPESFEILLKEDVTENSKTDFIQQMKNSKYVDEVTLHGQFIDRFQELFDVIYYLGALIIVMSLICLTYLITLMIRIFISQSRSEIEIYSLLGATRWSIYKVYIKPIFTFLIFSCGCALIFSYYSFKTIKQAYVTNSEVGFIFNRIEFFNTAEMMAFLFVIFFMILSKSFQTIQKSVNALNQTLNE